MSRTWHATGTGSFTRAYEVRADRSALRNYNKDPKNALKQELEPMHGATRSSREGTINHEDAREMIRNGDKIRTPDGILHVVRESNREELIGRLGATIQRPAKNSGIAAKGSNVQQRGSVSVYKGNAADKKKNSDGTVKVPSRGQKGAAPRSGPNPFSFLSVENLMAVGRGSSFGRAGKKDGAGTFGIKNQLGPTSTYKPSPNSKNTQIQKGQSESKGNTKLNTRAEKTGGFLPRSSKSVVGAAGRAKLTQNAKDRAANKAAGIKPAPRAPRGPSTKALPSTIRSTTRINLKPNTPKPRKGGRSGEGRSK